MPIRTLRTSALATALAAGTLTMLPVPTAGATAGTPAAGGSYAYTAHIAIGDSYRACTGALVDRYWVATAASCFATDPANPTGVGETPARTTTVTVGRTDLGASGTGAVRTVDRLVAHPERDLVLARLATPVDGITPLRVATATPTAAETLRVPAYGRTATDWIPGRLHTGTFTLNTVRATAIDTTGTGGSALCKGDSGAPVVREGGAGAELVAVVSRSWQGGCLGETETRTGASSTRVDDLGTWIKEVRYRTADVKPGTHLQVVGSNDTLWDTVVDHRNGRWNERWALADSGTGPGAGPGTHTTVDSIAIGNTVHVFAIGTDGHVYTRDGVVGGAWTAWQEVPGGASGVQDITATTRGTRVSLQVVGGDGRLHTTGADYATGTWDPHWVKVDDNAVKAVTSAATPDNTVHVYGIGTDQRVYFRDNRPDGTWTNWDLVPGGAGGVKDITAAARGNTVSVQVVGGDDRLHTITADYATGTAGWEAHWVKVDDNAVKAVTSAATPDNTVHVYGIGTDQRVYFRDNRPDGTWTNWDL
ncbi:trypsin-like serine protease, partial [Kitasatospora sp. NPDC056327]|uniref:trypsin-like serine protease n=1 Tax=Kitasatospora sp. NPDC056327 TaxID=3345785 RepID=UPI0035DBD61E